MKTIRWLTSLAKEKPILFIVAILLIGITGLISVIKYEEAKYSNCENEKNMLQQRFDTRLDSINREYARREEKLNNEVKGNLNLMITNYKTQLAEQQKVNRSFKKIVKNKSK